MLKNIKELTVGDRIYTAPGHTEIVESVSTASSEAGKFWLVSLVGRKHPLRYKVGDRVSVEAKSPTQTEEEQTRQQYDLMQLFRGPNF